ncbi:24859_t:CDS:1, partial [Gigaspora rosea]
MKDQVRTTRVEKLKVQSEGNLNSRNRSRGDCIEEREGSKSGGKKREDRMP